MWWSPFTCDIVTMPFHMDHGPLGFVFTDYESYRPVPNIRVDQVLQQAITAVAAALKRDPSLEYRPLTGEGAAKSTLPVDEINLYIEPRFPYMTLGNLYAVFELLRVWATRISD